MAQRQILTGIRHGYTGYTVKGCGCDICRAAFREYKQDYRQRQREKRANDMQHIEQPEDTTPEHVEDDYDEESPEPGTWVDDVDDPCYEDEELPDNLEKGKSDTHGEANAAPQSVFSAADKYQGPVVLGVNKDLEERNVDDSAPGLAALARRLAQIIDNPLALPQAPAAAARLLDVYKQIGVQIKPRGSKLAAVKELLSVGEDKEQQAS